MLQTSLQQADVAMDRLTSANIQLQAGLESQLTCTSEWQGKYMHVKADLEVLKTQTGTWDEMRKENADMAAHITSLTQQLSESQQSLLAATEQHTALKAQSTRLSMRIDELTSQLSTQQTAHEHKVAGMELTWREQSTQLSSVTAELMSAQQAMHEQGVEYEATVAHLRRRYEGEIAVLMSQVGACRNKTHH